MDDAEAFYAADPQGFFVAVDQNAEPIASISVVNHTPDFAFLGLYIVRPDFRGRGIGLGLWAHALRHARSRTIGLDGVEAQQDNYRASGFTYAGGTTRFTGQISGQPQPVIETFDPADITALVQMEAAASGVSKPEYLHPWLTGTSNRTTFVMRDQGAVVGFCTIRACQTGAKIGPLVAENAAVARKLVVHASAGFAGPISMDVPDTSIELQELCRTLGWQPSFKTARMYRGGFDAPKHTCFAVSSLELG
nr:GNAT family N-acetyltransferase [Tateyamaria sp. syn59]